MLFMFKEADAKKMATFLCNANIDSSALTEEMELTTVKEVANILAGAYLTALTKFTDLSMLPAVPTSKIGSKAAIEDMVCQTSESQMILVKSILTIEEEQFEVIGSLVLSLREGELTTLLDKIKSKYGATV